MASDPLETESPATGRKPGTIPTRGLHATAEAAAAAARGSFVAFRRIIRPTMLWDWSVERISLELQLFYDAFAAGKRPKLAIMLPAQHGKTWAAEDFIAWVAGKNPDLKTIYTSYSENLGTMRNHNPRRTIKSPTYRGIFRDTRIGEKGWQASSGLIEYVDHTGSFRNTTVGGPITGLEQHLGVVDDPVKGRAEANSRLVRDRTWNWFVDDLLTRFASRSALLVIMTRWHVDDLLGRLIRKERNVRTLAYPAIAEEDDGYRRKGEALFPALKPLDFLLERKNLMSQASWEAEYQQHPYLVGGGMIPIENLRTIPFFDRSMVLKSVLACDKAGTEGGDGAYTAIVLMHQLKDGRFVIADVVRGHWSALTRETTLKQLAQYHWDSLNRYTTNFMVAVEMEPGSGGKESAEATVRNLAGFNVIADRVTGNKVTRADPFAAQVQGNNVYLLAGSWQADFLDEAESWPNSTAPRSDRRKRDGLPSPHRRPVRRLRHRLSGISGLSATRPTNARSRSQRTQDAAWERRFWEPRTAEFV
jgi:predicted phage terminase large subunit-like protein